MKPNKRMKNFFAFTIMSAIILVAATSPIFAQKGKMKFSNSKQTKLWEQIDESRLQMRAERADLPEKYLVFRLDEFSFKNSLTRLPAANTNAAEENPLILEVPMADGTVQRFRMEETQVLSAELAADFPDWKTFTGYGIDNPTAVGQFDWNTLGFHGYVSTGSDTVIIDPYQKGDTKNYLVYNKSDYGKPGSEFYCRVENKMEKITESDYKPDFLPNAPTFTFGAQVRTYRLAVATTGEWARNAAGYNGTQTPVQIRTAALAVITTTVNRLNGIYIRELASQFQLVNPSVNNNATNIVFDDPATDPYNNTDGTDQLTINHTTITNRRGTANFDIGHLYGTGGGGVAQSPSLCDDADKGQGYSARGTNTGDPFVVDYVAHEIGHQFGANHTYNNADTSGACTTRSAPNAFEVGSGSTIMSYVGICTDRNLQQYVDTGFPSFHIRSLTEIITNITTGAPQQTGCGTSLGTNSVPTVNPGASYMIPKLTPFTLTATGADADGGDAGNLLYSWEEYDLAPSASGANGVPPGTYDVDNDGVLRPLFRAYSPVSGTARTFPSLNFILNPNANDQTANVNGVASNQPVLTYTGTHPTNAPGAVCETGVTCVMGERLPTQSRTMNFRVSLRDRRGGVADAGTTVTVASGAGPFQVTVQNSSVTPTIKETDAAEAVAAPAVTWQAGTTQSVSWDVANTNAAPISTTNVNILLSTDGGLTFPVTLKANTPNDGSEPITVPNNPTQTARIKVEAVGNIFFDINNVNFAITAPTAATVSVLGRVVSTTGRGMSGALVTATDQRGGIRTARTNSFGYYRFDDVEAGATYIFSVSLKRYGASSRIISLIEDVNEFNFTLAYSSLR